MFIFPTFGNFAVVGGRVVLIFHGRTYLIGDYSKLLRLMGFLLISMNAESFTLYPKAIKRDWIIKNERRSKSTAGGANQFSISRLNWRIMVGKWQIFLIFLLPPPLRYQTTRIAAPLKQIHPVLCRNSAFGDRERRVGWTIRWCSFCTGGIGIKI